MRAARTFAALLFLVPCGLADRPAQAEDLFLLRSSGLAMLAGASDPVGFDQTFVLLSDGGAAGGETLKRLISDKGFGFIAPENGSDFFGPDDGGGPTVLFVEAAMGTLSEDGTFRLECLVETFAVGSPGRTRNRRGMALLTVEKMTPIDNWLFWTFEGDIQGTAVTAGRLRPLHDRFLVK